MVSTHSRPKAADPFVSSKCSHYCFNTQPPEGGWRLAQGVAVAGGFQHTAARRRLKKAWLKNQREKVSTHSRPKAAADLVLAASIWSCFNTQPPEGGCQATIFITMICKLFQHTAARRRLFIKKAFERYNVQFQHTAARRRLKPV